MSHFAPESTGLLAPLKRWLDDGEVSEILINKPGEIYVEKNGALTQFEVKEFNSQAIQRLFQLIANENNQELHEKKPLLSASLQDGSRVQIVLPPTAKHLTLAIPAGGGTQFYLGRLRQQSFL